MTSRDFIEDFTPVFASDTEAVIRARWDAWANEGLTIEDVDEWVDTRPGSFFYIATTPGVREAAKLYDLMGTEYVGAGMPLWAWGEYLDDHAEGVTIERLAATSAGGEVTFTAPVGTDIDAGTRVAVESTIDTQGQEYEVTAGGTVGGGGTIDLPVVAIEAGSLGNASAGAVTSPRTPTAATVIANADAIVGGTDAESDEALRERLLARFGGRGPGNQRDYEAWARAYGGVGRVHVIPLWDGPGTVLVILLTAEGDSVAPETVTGFQAFIDPVAGQGAGEAPVGATVTVATATAVPVDVAGTVEFEAGYSLDGAGGTIALREAIETAIAEVIDAAEPGGEVVRQKVVGRIATMSGVHDVGGVLLNGVAANVVLDSDPAQVAELDDTSGIVAGSV